MCLCVCVWKESMHAATSLCRINMQLCCFASSTSSFLLLLVTMKECDIITFSAAYTVGTQVARMYYVYSHTTMRTAHRFRRHTVQTCGGVRSATGGRCGGGNIGGDVADDRFATFWLHTCITQTKCHYIYLAHPHHSGIEYCVTL